MCAVVTVLLLYNLNVIQLQLVSTGAFEISVDSMPLWSKIESGRIPQPPELFQILDNHFKMNAGHDNYLNPGMITKWFFHSHVFKEDTHRAFLTDSVPLICLEALHVSPFIMGPKTQSTFKTQIN